MRKFNFLIGAVSGLLGGVLLSNKKLRNKLKKAEDPKEAAKILGEEMKRSGKEFAMEAKEFVGSKESKSFWKKMKKSACNQCHSLQEKAGEIASGALEKAKECLPDVKKKAKKVVRNAKKQIGKIG